ncbi:MAG: HAD-IIB family hydrolase [Nitrospiraceae bacterium]
MVVFTDLDGSLLDPRSYSFEAAREALQALHARRIPVILVSSKTRAEIEPIRFRLHLDHPFISENGGGVFIPKGYFGCPLEGAVLRSGYQVIELGVPYGTLRTVLKEIERATGCPLVGFGDMSIDDIVQRTGLSRADALLAKQREYDEPFQIEGTAAQQQKILGAIESRKLRWTRGSRFHHLLGGTDKGIACRRLMQFFNDPRVSQGRKVVTVGLGDSLNDLPMLTVVDHPILVQTADGSYDPDIRLPNLIQIQGIGPVGWNRAILARLDAGTECST